MNNLHYKQNIGYKFALSKDEKIDARNKNVYQRFRCLSRYFKKIPGLKILEIGSHEGLFLKILKDRGFIVLGVEPNKYAADFAASLGIKTIKGLFEEAIKDISEKFGAVCLYHTLEHMENADENLKKIKNILDPKGYLFIEVPNIESYRSKKYGETWEYMYPEHLHYFSPVSLKKILEKAGFTAEKIYFRDFNDFNLSIKASFDRLLPYKFFKNQKRKHDVLKNEIEIKKIKNEAFGKKVFFLILWPARIFLAFLVKILKRGDFILVVAKLTPCVIPAEAGIQKT